MTLERFYPIVENATWVARLVNAGAKLIQLRIKDADFEHVRAEIRKARKTCEAKGAQLIVNDYWQIALEEKCDFIHLGQEDLGKANLAAIKKAGIKLGLSTHSRAELARALYSQPDYIALGPIFETNLKKMPWEPQGLDRIKEWKRLIGKVPLVVVGGITLERAAKCLKAGADSIAVVTDIVQAEDPEARAAAWIEKTKLAA
jgi:thiamine-phosphate pyrophosphorylase